MSKAKTKIWLELSTIRKHVKKLFFGALHDFFRLFFPRICAGCNQSLVSGEEEICLNCLADLPKTNFSSSFDNEVARTFWGRVPIYQATAFCYFNKGANIQHMLHALKYGGNTETGRILGTLMGRELIRHNSFQDIEIIIPVPLHPKKFKKRGFNQSEEIAKGVCSILTCDISVDNLIRKVDTSSQTRKNRFERYENVRDSFEIRSPETFENKHILLVDDVITTGATLEACSELLHRIPGVKISVATVAYAQ